jgi:hypothetical protein
VFCENILLNILSIFNVQMKRYIKTTILLLCMALLIAMGACKKETLAGTYYCAHYYGYDTTAPPIYGNEPNWLPVQQLTGYGAVSIYRSTTNSNTLYVNGDVLTFYSFANGINQYYSSATNNSLQLTTNNDSMIYTYDINDMHVDGYYTDSIYAGHRIN